MPSINFRSNYAAMCVSERKILASILHHAAGKGENCFPCLVNIFLLHRQQVLLLHQAYNFVFVEEEFRIRRRNQRRAILTFFSQVNQQNVSNEDEEELGFGHVHKTVSIVCWQAEISIFFGKSILE